VPVALNLVQLKNGPISVRQCVQRSGERNPIEAAPQPLVVPAVFTPGRENSVAFAVVIEGNLWRSLFPKMHESCVDSEPIEPCRQGGFSAKRGQLSEHLDENVLRQVVGLGGVVRHSKNDGVYAVFVHLEKRGKCVCVSVQCSAYKAEI